MQVGMKPQLVSLILASSWLLAQVPAGAESAFQAGKSAYQAGEFKKAAELFEKAVELGPPKSAYYHWLGKATGRRAETTSFLVAPKLAVDCRKAFEKAVAADPDNLEAWNDLFEYYLSAPGFLGGGQDKAAQAIEQIGRLDPVEKHFAQARLAEKQKDYTSAEQHLRQAAELEPKKVGRWIDLARFLARRGSVQDSDAAFAKAEQADAASPKLWYARARTYIEGKRNLELARQLLEKYLASDKLTPDDPSKEEARQLVRKAAGG
jgi:cytochrome c-type biogenesis protein CcmH/NrfG